MESQRIFITGGASGLGRALAEHYARRKARVCIGDVNDARGAETLAALQALGAQAHYLHCDVTTESQLQQAAVWLQEHWGGVDIVYNNAGVAIAGGIDEIPLKDWQWIVDINLLGVVRGCRVFVPLLRRQGHGHIVNIASMAGLIHPPMMSAYNATKAAVVALSETLRAELAAGPVRVSVVCPSFFKTNLGESLRTSDKNLRLLTRKLVDQSKHGADAVAKRIVKGVAHGEFHILTHRGTTPAWLFKRMTPYGLYFAAMMGVMRLGTPAPTRKAKKDA